MSKKLFTTVAVALGALGATGLAQAQGADGPSYPALDQMHSVASRAQVQAATREANVNSAAVLYAGAAEGASYPALEARVDSPRSRGEVSAQARTVVSAAVVLDGDDRYGA